MNKGMVEAWTGVIRENPIEKMASRIHSASGGVRESQALGSFSSPSLGAIMKVGRNKQLFVQDLLNFRVIAISKITLVQKRTSVSLPGYENPKIVRSATCCHVDNLSHPPPAQITTTLLLAQAWDQNIIMQCSFALLHPLHWSR